MAKTCDNTSVAILVRRGQLTLMVERKKNNFGFALPAGHQDGDSPKAGAERELFEESGLEADELREVFVLNLPNTCGRSGSHHVWTMFEAVRWHGEVKPSESETKSYLWASPEIVADLVAKLEKFAAEKQIPLTAEHLKDLEKATDADPLWQKNPGLEPPMYFLFKQLGII